MTIDASTDQKLGRPLRLGMVGGGQGAFIGAVHRIAARLDGHYELVAGALASDPDRALASARELLLDEDRAYTDYAGNAGPFVQQPPVGIVGQGSTEMPSGVITAQAWGTTNDFYMNSNVRFASITDGLSSTFLVGEKHVTRDYFGPDHFDGPAFSFTDWWFVIRLGSSVFPLAQKPAEEFLWGFFAELYRAGVWLVVLGAGLLTLFCIIRGLEGERFKIPFLGDVTDRL